MKRPALQAAKAESAHPRFVPAAERLFKAAKEQLAQNERWLEAAKTTRVRAEQVLTGARNVHVVDMADANTERSIAECQRELAEDPPSLDDLE